MLLVVTVRVDEVAVPRVTAVGVVAESVKVAELALTVTVPVPVAAA